METLVTDGGDPRSGKPSQSERELVLLVDAAEALATARRLDDIHEVMVRSAARLLGGGGQNWRASFSELTDGELRRAAVHDEAGIELDDRAYALDEYPALRRVVETGEALVGDARLLSAAIPDDRSRLVAQGGVTAAAMIRVAHGGETFGVLSLTTRDAVDESRIPVRRLTAIAHLGALAIANSRVFAEQQEVIAQTRELERTKTNFLNLVAHEMRGPVAVLRGYISMLAQGDLGPPTEKMADALSTLVGKADEMTQLVTNMIETAQLEEGRLQLAMRHLDLREVVDETARALSPWITHTHPLTVDVGNRPLHVSGDRERLGVLVTNLLDNAGKYSPAGAPIAVRCAAAGDSAVVAVTDRGIGLSEEDRSVLFTRFGRIVRPETRHVPGSGLGLWLSREIARLHGGEITVSSDRDAGSTFSVILPRRGGSAVVEAALARERDVVVTSGTAPIALLVDSVVDYAIFVLDADGYVSTWNEGARRLKQYEASEIIGQHFAVFYTPEDRAAGRPRRLLDEAVRNGRVEDEGWRVRKDGSRFWADVVITALRAADGRLRGFGKVTRDLTERRLAEQALRDSEERLRLMVESVVDYAIFMLDPHGNVASWNEGAHRLKQYEASEIIGRHFSVLYPAEDREAGKPQRLLNEAVRSGRVEDRGWRLRKDGTRFWAHVVITALRGQDGQLRGFAKVTRDLTGQSSSTTQDGEQSGERPGH